MLINIPRWFGHQHFSQANLAGRPMPLVWCMACLWMLGRNSTLGHLQLILGKMMAITGGFSSFYLCIYIQFNPPCISR